MADIIEEDQSKSKDPAGSTSRKKKDIKQKGDKGGNPAGDGKGQQKGGGNKSPRQCTQQNTEDAKQTDPSKTQKHQKDSGEASQTDPHKPKKSKSELKAERRALQVGRM